MPGKQKYADVILPLAISGYYTYKIPPHLHDAVQVGQRVSVALGKRRYYTAIIRKLHNNPPAEYEIREIISVNDPFALVTENQMLFWEWLADYYMCTTGEVYRAAIPTGLKPESETRVALTENVEVEGLSEAEIKFLDQVKDAPGITIKAIAAALDKKDVMPQANKLIEKKLITLFEDIRISYKEKLKDYIVLTEELNSEEKILTVLDKLEKRAPKQYKLLNEFLHLAGQESISFSAEVSKEKLLSVSGTSHAILNALIKKNIFQIKQKEVSRLRSDFSDLSKPKELNERQRSAFQKINDEFSKKDVVLLHGVTSSGKTEIYIHLIAEQIKKGRQVLYLLPEIALTAQIINRLQKVFGEKVGIYHSKFSDAERVEVYQNLAGIKKQGSPSYQVILGVRSSVFLPFKDLGLIIVDEEHENTYKQFDPAPRYNARDASVVLAKMHNAKVLMGTATPSFETYMNAKTGKYGLVELFDRYLDIQLPAVEVIDVRQERRKKRMRTFFSPQLIESIEETLNNNEQIILFQNRRGYAPYIECDACGWIPFCKHCDVSLTYHKKSNRLTCHYCGYSIQNPASCPSCKSSNIQTRGFGTEKIEDEIKLMFPEAKVARMDLDTTRSRRSYQKIIEDFENQKVNILIGTQMVSKGLDFDHVRVVGILNADNMLNFPDFRSYERSFQLIAQVSGRAGRKNERGKVIIQTGDQENVVIKHVIDNDYSGFFNHQLGDRKTYKYPPFYRLVKLTIRHKNLGTMSKAANQLAAELKRSLGNRVIGPEFPLINRVFNYHQKCILVKTERDMHFSERRKAVKTAMDNILKSDDYKSLQVIPDVDPYN
ncbi:MAG: primosomal protein N' [Bacteroidales bacterium]|nr:primosomal protein N' [Bacteroidales bacterium]